MSDVKIIREGHKCLRCGYEWIPRFPDRNPPVSCPKCRSIVWNKPRTRNKKVKGINVKELARELNPRRQIIHEELKEMHEKESKGRGRKKK